MLANRLVTIAKDLVNEYRRFNIVELLDKAAGVSNSRASVNDNQYSVSVTELRARADEIIKNSVFNTYPEDLLKILNESNFSSVLPTRIANIIRGGFRDVNKNSAISSAEVSLHATEVRETLPIIHGFLQFAARFHINSYEIPEGRIGVDLRLPRSAFNNELASFSNALTRFDRFFQAIIELTTGTREDVTIVYLSSTDPVTAVAFVAATVVGVFKIYKSLLEVTEKELTIKKAIRDLKNSEIPEESKPQLTDEHRKKMVQSLVGSAVEQVVAEVKSDSLDEGRVNELKTELKSSSVVVIGEVAAGARLSITIESQSQIDQLMPDSEKVSYTQLRELIQEHRRLESKVDGLIVALSHSVQALDKPESS